MLRSNFCGYKYAYILVMGDITIIGHKVTQAAFKNCAQFIKCITRIDSTTIDDAGDLDLVMLMYNLLDYRSNYSSTTVSFMFLF